MLIRALLEVSIQVGLHGWGLGCPPSSGSMLMLILNTAFLVLLAAIPCF